MAEEPIFVAQIDYPHGLPRLSIYEVSARSSGLMVPNRLVFQTPTDELSASLKERLQLAPREQKPRTDDLTGLEALRKWLTGVFDLPQLANHIVELIAIRAGLKV